MKPTTQITTTVAGLIAITLAIAIALMAPIKAQAQSPAFTGTAPARGEEGLLVVAVDSSPTGLSASLAGAGCGVETLATLTAGAWSVYVQGAPAIVNAAFPASLPAGTPFFVRCSQTAVAAAPAPTPAPAPASTVTATGPNTLQGSGQATGTWTPPAGLVLLKFDVDDAGAYSIARAGSTVVEGVGPARGSAVVQHAGGALTLEIDTPGPWTVEVVRPTSEPQRPFGGYFCTDSATWAPESSSGLHSLAHDEDLWVFLCTGPDVSPPLELGAFIAFVPLFDGDGHVHAWLVDSEGRAVLDLLDQDGPVDDTARAFQLPRAGTYRLVVQAEGDWGFFIGTATP